MIIEGTITYDPSKRYEITPVNVPGKDQKGYWIVGTLKIDRILFANKESRHADSYRQYLKEIDKEHPVLIPAFARQTLLSHGPVREPSVVQPTIGLDIPEHSTIFNLSQFYAYPVLNLVLESVVPRENRKEAAMLIEKRINNLLKIK